MKLNSWPIIVGGCHRSGTSLVRRLLDAHSRIHCGPEIKFFRDFYGDYPDDYLREFRYIATARTVLPAQDLMDILGRAFVKIHERAAELENKTRWADKCPENVLYLIDWERLLGEKWLFVHVVRNPLDTLASIKEAQFPRTIPADLEGRIAFYNRYTRAGLSFGYRHPHRYYRLQYERLVMCSEATIASMMEWLGETFEPSQLVFNEKRHQIGLEDAKVAHTSVIHSESLDRWRMVLSAEEARIIRDQTAETWAMLNTEVPSSMPLSE
jgi:hypothetical protein